VFLREGARGSVWYAKYRLPDGRQVKKRIGPAWTGRGRAPAGFGTRRDAEAWLAETLGQAGRGTLFGMVATGVTFATACDECLHWLEHERQRKPSTLRDYRSIIGAHLLPSFAEVLVEDITPADCEAWQSQLRMGNRTKIKVMTVFFGVMERARKRHKLPHNPVRDLEKPVQRKRVDIDVFSPEEVMALVRAAGSEQDAAIFLTAAFTGLRRGELVALRWRDVDFARSHIRVRASYTEGGLTSPKSGRIRSVPMAPDVATALARLGDRAQWTGDGDLVFPGTAGGFLDASALYRRYKLALRRAGLRDLRFHDLRHTFGTQVFASG
jgi:integrase